MSRVDEALERHLRGSRRPVSAPPQENFEPAWSPSETAPATELSPPPVSNFDGVTKRADGHGIASLSSAWRARLAGGPDADPHLVEQFRQLASTLHHLQRANNIRSVMVTSAVAGDGKTLVAVNLALVLAQSYHAKVLLIDADLRKPSIPYAGPLAGGAGLSDALRAENDQPLTLVQLTPTLTLLPAGQPIPNSIEALTSPRMRLILEEAVERFDWVVLDAGPIGPTTDPRILTAMVDGAVFVVRAGVTQFDDIQKGVDALGRDHILGVVLNGADASRVAPYYGTR